MWWQYTITFAGSLIVALISVWVSQSWSYRRDYKRALQNLRNELSINIKAATLITQWIDMNANSLKQGQLVVASCPRFYDSVWISEKGLIALRDHRIIAGLEDAYLMASVVNNLLNKIDELKWEIGGSLPNVGKRVTLILDAAKQIVNNQLLPMLANGKRPLDRKLRLQIS